MAVPKTTYGVSLSVKACQQWDLDPITVMRAAIRAGWRRFRLMSYWDEIEPRQGTYDWLLLDKQIQIAQQTGCEVTLCLGMRQPRWPECHMAAWAKNLPEEEFRPALSKFITAVVKRYQERDCMTSWQLENEAFNKGIGMCRDFSRERLIEEFELVKSLDDRPVVMTTSNNVGLPLLGPLPDAIGFSVYLHQAKDGAVSQRHFPASMFRLRRLAAEHLLRRPVFCHELQMEPWGPMGTERMKVSQQLQLMNPHIARRHLEFAQSIGFDTIDLWGLEWWYWLAKHGNQPGMWDFMRQNAATAR